MPHPTTQTQPVRWSARFTLGVALALLAVSAALAGVTITLHDDGSTTIDPGDRVVTVNNDATLHIAASAKQRARRNPARIPDLGINLSPYTDYADEWAFTDAMTRARPWLINTPAGDQYNTEGQYPTDELGWPLPADDGSKPFTLMFVDMEGHYPAGDYTLIYEGDGDLSFGWDAQLGRRKGANTFAVHVPTPNRGIYLRVDRNNPDNPIRNIRLFMPGYAPGEPNEGKQFHDLFLERLQPFQVIRFMNWQNTNNSPVTTFDTRTTPDHATQHRREGVALEHMIALCNELQADPWFCIPHQADDEYVVQFAQVVAEHLDRSLTPYIEYSNEVWNGGFEQARWAQEQGLAAELEENAFKAQIYFHSKRSVEIFNLFDQGFGTRRFVRCMGSQAANPWVSEQVLEYNQAFRSVDLLAVAPYFGHGVAARIQEDPDNTTVDQVMQWAGEELLETTEPNLVATAQVAQKYRVALGAYESGQHLVGLGGTVNDQRVTDLLIAANRDPRMGDLTRRLRNGFRQVSGGAPYVSYAFVRRPSKWGSWGHLETMDQPLEEAHKYRELIDR